jgi:hypothetical protein
MTIWHFVLFYWCFAALYFIGLIDLRKSNWTGILLSCILSGVLFPYSLGRDAMERKREQNKQRNVKEKLKL